MILQNIATQYIAIRLVRNWRTPVRIEAYSSSLRGALRTMLLLLMLTLGVGMACGQTNNITALSQITDPDGHYVITQDISGGTPGVPTFNGTLQADIDPQTHMPYRIKNLSVPLFTTLTGTVKNLVLEDVDITSGDASGNTGAIACNVTGTSTNKAVIYNCGILSGSVSGSGKVGGLVGVLGQEGNTTETNDNCYARVINCYSFADIEGGTVKGGIVGYNCYASKYNDLRSMVMNCMFYGNIDFESGSVSPIYGGLEISNDYNNNDKRLNNYNYFLYEALFSEGRHITSYNCGLAAEERFLVRFEFYRHLLNSTRELAAWYATGSATQSSMLKWVLETADRTIANPKPYPILKAQGKYPSIINIDADNAPSLTLENDKPKEEDRKKGGKLGTKTLSVTIRTKSQKTSGGQSWPTATASDVQTTSLTLTRTDKDFDRFNFNYDKVQLPYYNDVGTGNYTEKRVVTGWKITDVSGGTQGERVAADFTTTTNYDAPYYNFADRDTYAKDLYSISGRVFAQGAYFNVPKDVTGITIEPYWAVCTYLSDANYDSYGYTDGGSFEITSGSTKLLSTRFSNDTDYPISGSEQKVYTSASNAVNNLSGVTSPTVYDYAVVLVGNYHACGDGEVSSGDKPFTIMSIDNNHDNEPDYSLIFRSAKNQQCSPIRYDFINVPAVAMAHKMASSTNLAIPGNCFPKGWFEVTTTGLIKFNQLEYSAGITSLSPLILMGGVVEQIVSTNNSNNSGKKRYLLFGDNVWFKRFANGVHGDQSGSTPHRPISVTGGEYEKFYLTGYFRPGATVLNDNAECYIDGGKFGEVAGAGQEQIGGNINWFVNHADIDDFFGGGINESKPILGNITNIISNSHIDQFCGGPKFGNMNTEKTVSTTANSSTFGSYYGAGYGGNAIYLNRVKNEYTKLNWPWDDWVSSTYDKSSDSNYRGKFASGQGIAIGYEYEFFAGSSGNVARLYIQKVSFSLAQTNNVSSTLTDCTVLNNFYGAGKLGKVAGDVTSTLTDCKVKGNVFGAGYSATKDDVEVLNLGGFTPTHNYNQTTGIYELGEFPGKVTYTWKQVNSISGGNQCLETGTDGNNYIKTTANLDKSNLGSVTGSVSLTITGTNEKGSVIGTADDADTGNVYGGGDESYVNNTTNPTTASTTVLLSGKTEVLGNVFGGGNNGFVSGSTTVNIE